MHKIKKNKAFHGQFFKLLERGIPRKTPQYHEFQISIGLQIRQDRSKFTLCLRKPKLHPRSVKVTGDRGADYSNRIRLTVGQDIFL